MDKNYYELLEIDRNASPEIIEKAYKALVKKYHPDLQEENKKQVFEEKLKKINEAYEVLSSPVKRESYDKTLKSNTFTDEDFKKLKYENEILKEKINNLNNSNNTVNNFISSNNEVSNINEPISNYSNSSNSQDTINKAINDVLNKAYYDAYIQDMKNRGYKVKYRKSFKDYLRSFIALIITIIILFLVFQIPFVKNYFTELYNNNPIIKSVVQSFQKD